MEPGRLLAVSIPVYVFLIQIILSGLVSPLSLEYGPYQDDLSYYPAEKRQQASDCPPWKPFPCHDGNCIPLSYVCDKNEDCPNGYDEDVHMCTAKRRPPADYTEDFLGNLLRTNGADFFVKFFGLVGANNLHGMGGPHAVAIALTGEPTVKEFAQKMQLSAVDTDHLAMVLKAIAGNDAAVLSKMNFRPQELASVKMYVSKLVDTGFLKPYNF
uniref:Prohormone-4 n=1 Tax=Romanomermis culicivorax TaxID=13658 RepID=A0A915IL83_ROMCU